MPELFATLIRESPAVLIDTHCHLDVEAFDPDRCTVIERAYTLGVRRIVIPAIYADAWQRVVDCSKTWPDRLYYALGLHPVSLARHEFGQLRELETRIDTDRPLAIGEIGLDFFLRDLDQAAQIRFFEAQLDIAIGARLPVLLHVRKAHDRILQCLKHRHLVGGIVHAYNGSLPQAQQYLDLGFKLGFGGMLTYERSSKLHALARQLPLSGLVLETDAPDLTVAQHRGQRNSPEYLPYCLTALARVRELDPMVVAAQTTANACAVLGLDAASTDLL
jgi:TatD DNase family protein